MFVIGPNGHRPSRRGFAADSARGSKRLTRPSRGMHDRGDEIGRAIC